VRESVVPTYVDTPGHLSGEFTNQDLYAFERELETLHPGNRHIRDKIRQQLQVLRDRGFLLHLARNRWQARG
jgi:type II restriction enzyme